MENAIQISTNWKYAPDVAKLSSERRVGQNLEELYLGVQKFSDKNRLQVYIKQSLEQLFEIRQELARGNEIWPHLQMLEGEFGLHAKRDTRRTSRDGGNIRKYQSQAYKNNLEMGYMYNVGRKKGNEMFLWSIGI